MNALNTLIVVETQVETEDEAVPEPERFPFWLSYAAACLFAHLRDSASHAHHSAPLPLPQPLADHLRTQQLTTPLSMIASHWRQVPTKPVTVGVSVVDRATSQALNQQHRRQDKPTNVLSFPGLFNPALQLTQIGDLVICAPVVLDESRTQGKHIDQHWAHMLVHGFLHLTGFDHENSTDADLMETLEIRILAGLGFPNPYVSESETGTLETSIPNPHHSNSRENVAPKHGDVSTEAST